MRTGIVSIAGIRVQDPPLHAAARAANAKPAWPCLVLRGQPAV